MSKTPEKLDVAISMVREENETALFSDEYQFVKKFLNRKRIVIVKFYIIQIFKNNYSKSRNNSYCIREAPFLLFKKARQFKKI